MYVIQNVSAHELALGDLRVTLRSKQRLDLDMICSRYVAEQSYALRMAIKKGIIRIISKDSFMSLSVKEAMPDDPKSIKEDSVTKEQLQEMEKRMTDTLTAQLRKIADKEQSQSIDPQSIAALAPLVQQLSSLISNASAAKPSSAKDEEVVDEKLVDIHTRSLDRMNKTVQGRIDHEEQINKSDVSERANELEGLL